MLSVVMFNVVLLSVMAPFIRFRFNILVWEALLKLVSMYFGRKTFVRKAFDRQVEEVTFRPYYRTLNYRRDCRVQWPVL